MCNTRVHTQPTYEHIGTTMNDSNLNHASKGMSTTFDIIAFLFVYDFNNVTFGNFFTIRRTSF
jgi:hypothetical protein